MRYFRYYHPLAIVALVAIATSPAWTNTADARPLNLEIVLDKRQAAHDPLAAAAPAPPHTAAPPLTDEPSPTKDPKPSSPAPATTHEPSPPATTDRPEPPTTTKSPQSTQQPSPPSPPKPVNPNPSTSQKAPTPHPSSDSPSSSHSGTSSSSNNSGTSLGTASANNTPQPTGSSNGLDDGSEVPTKVSDKVFVGLGAVGSLFLFSLGGVAFCRHRKKKNLAAALLRQTEQFNHNNPYAKISEAAAASNSNNINMSGKESLPMTPTKPIGTFSVVSDYTPAMPDEIEIYYGDSVTVLQEYDDGWCMGINNSRGGIKGVVPRHCLSGGKNNNNNNGGYDDGGHDGGHYGGGGDDGYYPPNPGFKAMANKRMSSMPAGGWNNGPPGGYQNGGGGHGGYGDYPPNPYNNQGPHLGTPNQGYYGGY